jgi:hypothetical protein
LQPIAHRDGTIKILDFEINICSDASGYAFLTSRSIEALRSKLRRIFDP